ncbi:MAG TPA: penicillin-binding transpeptidase domain-containing protein [Acidimicrobiales bacterium]|nr:penicillin-binding transpeptidase domain-containing protein [Acidimicrobiales bacterium]
MARRIRWLGVAMVACFLALFLQLNNVQVVKAHQYATSPHNPAVIEAQYDQPRGVIQSADGVVLAQSVRAKKGAYKYQRVYPEGALFAHVTGYLSYNFGATGVEDVYASYMQSHNRPIKTIGDLLTTPVVTDTVTLTLSSKLQLTAQQALGGRAGAIVVLDPTTGAVRAMYSNPTYDPNPLAVNDIATEAEAFKVDNAADPATGFAPAVSLAYQDIFPPGSTFKIVTTTAAYEHAPNLVNTPMPYYTCIPGGTLGGQAPNRPLCNYGSSGCGGTIATMLPPSCDTGYAILGTRVGAASMTAQADAFGFNQQPPIDLPHSRYEVSQFLQPACYRNAQIFLANSSIGQQCTIASPLQMALVAAGIANGGEVMTPHVMYEIRDSQNNLVKRYAPTPWLRAATQKTASAVAGLMQNVVKYGTASGVGFPPQDDVAAKTGTAQVGQGNSATTDWMIAFAPASQPKVAVAVVIPHQSLSATGAEVAGPVMRTMIQAALAGQ